MTAGSAQDRRRGDDINLLEQGDPGRNGWLAARGHLPGAAWMAAGILLTLIAAGLQATRVVPRLELIWTFDHNGLFHLVQMPALVLLTLGLGAALRRQPQGAATVRSA